MYPGNIPEAFLDTDVAFDIISKREPHYVDSIKLLSQVNEGTLLLSISESTVSTLLYLSEAYKITDHLKKLTRLIAVCNVVTAGKQIILDSVSSEFKDKEDAIQYFTALRNNLDYFISRNIKDYQKYATSIPVYTPKQFLRLQ